MIELIRNNEEDTNNYTEALKIFDPKSLLKQPIKEDVIAIWKFFANEEKVLSGLKDFAEQYFVYNQSGKKTLRQFFDAWGKENHFNCPTASLDDLARFQTSENFQYPDCTPILYGELSSDIFQNVLLRHGYLSADIGAGPEHGKWTHSIQLFLLEEARKKGDLKLNAKTVSEFIQNISHINSTNLWMLLFDSFDDNIFTCPNNIAELLTSDWDDGKEAKFLSAKLKGFEEKFCKAANLEKDRSAYAKANYWNHLQEASYIKQQEKYGLLWFKPKETQQMNHPLSSNK